MTQNSINKDSVDPYDHPIKEILDRYGVNHYVSPSSYSITQERLSAEVLAEITKYECYLYLNGSSVAHAGIHLDTDSESTERMNDNQSVTDTNGTEQRSIVIGGLEIASRASVIAIPLGIVFSYLHPDMTIIHGISIGIAAAVLFTTIVTHTHKNDG